MIKTKYNQQPQLTEEQIEKAYWDELKFKSHMWNEDIQGYYTCEFCDRRHTSTMPIDSHPLCTKNPHLNSNNL